MSQFSEGREWNPTSSKEESEREVKIQISSIEYRLTYARASGSGGQNVNKRDTKAVLHWNIDTSHVFTPEQKELIKERSKNRINKRTGELVLSFDRERTQETNTREVIKLLHTLVEEAIHIDTERIPTIPTRGSQERRIEGKKQEGRKKEGRRWRLNTHE
jgi:ribosome-associated protein